ncbi:ABC transporter permease [Herbaspirillum sp. alder98]|uniref:ABC transporter permease n=1 Tax=Herbaspirillum sp. alder98 TaxID=2913096 RepID=UPI001CD8920F|nr:ABC transporter permease [Herbaspirillum sp. alder98]MCA1323050.1 ABC transporter permease [Herbaspirillum sp. alder98]
MKPIKDALEQRPWAWSFIGAALLWLATLAVAGPQAAFNIALSALSFGALMALVGLGQMLVVTTGPGNIDLSIPAAIGLTGAVAVRAMGGEDGGLATGIGVALLLGVAIGLCNYALIRLLQIPPIIATMSSAFILQSLAIHSGQGLKITPPELLANFATGWLLRLPLLAWAVLVVTLALAWILARTLFGRHLSAVGQNARAAWLAGISVERIRCLCYVLCAVCAALCALLIAGFSGGASLDMGSEYLLMSVAVVVIGGTSVTGGRASVAGIWGAALFLYFTNTLLNVIGLSAGGRSVLTGVIIIAVIVLSARRRQYR